MGRWLVKVGAAGVLGVGSRRQVPVWSCEAKSCLHHGVNRQVVQVLDQREALAISSRRVNLCPVVQPTFILILCHFLRTVMNSSQEREW